MKTRLVAALLALALTALFAGFMMMGTARADTYPDAAGRHYEIDCARVVMTQATPGDLAALVADKRCYDAVIEAAARQSQARTAVINGLLAAPAEPEPEPTQPTDEAPPSDLPALTIDGDQVTPTGLDTITTETGVWPVYALGAVDQGKAYLFRLEARPEWWSVCIVRDVVVERGPANDGRQYENVPLWIEKPYAVTVGGEALTLTVGSGAMRCADNGEPVAPSMERLRKAVADKRVIPYGERAFAGWPYAPEWALTLGGSYAPYAPDRHVGIDGNHTTIGTINSTGGEYSSSRGFLSGEDALMIAAALKGDAAMFADVAAVAHSQVLYGLTLDNFAVWSMGHDVLRDPQLPFDGDRPYAVGTNPAFDHMPATTFWCAAADYKYLADIGVAAGACGRHDRDGEHLFNHGYAYWLATGDPRAALLQQVIAAYALSAPYHGANPDGTYRIQFGYQRWTLNIFTAMWKLRDVEQHLSTENDKIFWPGERAEKMWTDILADWKTQIAELDASTTPKWQEMSALYGYDATPTIFSNFMAQGYGPEVAYLWASAGDGALLTRLAAGMAWRINTLGGTLGMMGAKGSTFVDIDGAATTREGIAALIRAAQPDRPTTTFDNAPYHYTLRAYWLLKMADDAAQRGWIAPVNGVPEAIAKIEAERDLTTDWRSQSVIGWKHAGVTFEANQ